MKKDTYYNNSEDDFFRLLAILLGKDLLEIIVGDFSPSLIRKILLDKELLGKLKERYFSKLKTPTINSYRSLKSALKKMERALRSYFNGELDIKLEGEVLYLQERKCPYGLENVFHLCSMLIFVAIFLGDSIRDLKIVARDGQIVYHIILAHTP